MWIRHSLYESLPLVYAVSGTIALATLGTNPLAIASATLLLVAGATTYLRRRSHRARERSIPAQRRQRRR